MRLAFTRRIYTVLLLWRSGRDSNPRTAFDRHTISSRARYDRFDTTPWHHRFCHFRNSSIILHKETVNVKSFPNYFCVSAEFGSEQVFCFLY